MAKPKTVVRILFYQRGFFVKGVTGAHQRTLTKREMAGEVEPKTIYMKWTTNPYNALDCDAKMCVWLTAHGYGVPVKFTMKLEGMPARGKFSWE